MDFIYRYPSREQAPKFCAERYKQDSKIIEETNLVEEINSLEESETIRALRVELFKNMGEALYKKRIHPLKFKKEDNILMVFAPTAFARDWIESRYREAILSVATRSFEEKDLMLEFKIIKDLEKT